jgi:hypothetical protein
LLGKHLQKYPPAFFSLFELLPFFKEIGSLPKNKMWLAALWWKILDFALAPFVRNFACSALVTAERFYFFRLERL